MNLKKYLSNPCGSLSIPYWKDKIIDIPANIQVYHEKDFINNEANNLKVEKFFRLIHRLNYVDIENQKVKSVNLKDDIDELVNMINICYKNENIQASKKNIDQWISRSVFDKDLWVKITINGKIIASGIAEFDFETKEGVLEWIQVLPEYQRKGYGKLIVNALINRLSKIADFITVSSRLENGSNPLKLYTECGFDGNDIWYICTKK
ncbi:MAG: GNAT family N-acetyltransferase [Firmicutes bacterium]|nr:GNAT family N-acetyltransferase [Bacillota bacterium]